MQLRPSHLVLLLLLTAPTAVVVAQPLPCSQFFPAGQPPALLNPKLATRTTLLCNDAYAALASGLTHGPLWSAERPTVETVSAARDTARESEFYADDRLPEADQAQLDDYRRSGFDRGHMTPSGDMPGGDAQEQSFALSNMVPQTPELNRGVWAAIEMAVRNLAVREGEMYVVTGPAFQGGEVRSIGPDGVLVPSATWKAVYSPRQGGAGAYLCSNTARPSCETMSIAMLSGIVGIDPFPGVPSGIKDVAMPLPDPDQVSRGRRHRPLSRRRDDLIQQPFEE